MKFTRHILDILNMVLKFLDKFLTFEYCLEISRHILDIFIFSQYGLTYSEHFELCLKFT